MEKGGEAMITQADLIEDGILDRDSDTLVYEGYYGDIYEMRHLSLPASYLAVPVQDGREHVPPHCKASFEAALDYIRDNGRP